MYNRYIPNGTAYTRVTEEDAPPFRRPGQTHEPGPSHPGPPGPEPPPRREEPPRSGPGQGGGPRQGGGPGQQTPPPRGAAVGGGRASSWLSGLLKM